MNGSYASSPCFGHELVFGSDGAEAVDQQTARDVGRWRKSERARLIDARRSVSAAERAATAKLVMAGLNRLIGEMSEPIVSVYWPFRGELDLRGWMKDVTTGGARVVLPVVVEKGAPLAFREWRPGCLMQRGVWNIPVPEGGEELAPDVVVAPVVGADPACYRLGYGGGFYDRTLAAMPDRPLVIGVGHPSARIGTIYPQPHDVPMHRMLLGDEQWQRPG